MTTLIDIIKAELSEDKSKYTLPELLNNVDKHKSLLDLYLTLIRILDASIGESTDGSITILFKKYRPIIDLISAVNSEPINQLKYHYDKAVEFYKRLKG